MKKRETGSLSQLTVKAESVLNGKDIEGPTLEATEILNECRRKIEKDEQEISIDEMKRGFKKWDERTSTSPSGRHLGMYQSFTNPRWAK